MTMARQIKTLEPFTKDLVDGFYSPSQDENWVPVSEGRIENTQDIPGRLRPELVHNDDQSYDEVNIIPRGSKYRALLPLTPDSVLELNQQNVVRVKGVFLSMKFSKTVMFPDKFVEFANVSNQHFPNTADVPQSNNVSSLPSTIRGPVGNDAHQLEYQGFLRFIEGGEVFQGTAGLMGIQVEGNSGQDAFMLKMTGESIPDKIFKSLIPLDSNSVVEFTSLGFVNIRGRVAVLHGSSLITDQHGAVRLLKPNVGLTHYRLLQFDSNVYTERKPSFSISSEFIDKIQSNERLEETLRDLYNVSYFDNSKLIKEFDTHGKFVTGSHHVFLSYGFKQETADEVFMSNMRIDQLNLTPITLDSIVKLNMINYTVEVIGEVCDWKFRKVRPGVYPFKYFNIARSMEHNPKILEGSQYTFPFHYRADGSLIQSPRIKCCRYAFGLRPIGHDHLNDVLYIYPYTVDREIWDNYTLNPTTVILPNDTGFNSWQSYYWSNSTHGELGAMSDEFIYGKPVGIMGRYYNGEVQGYYAQCFPFTFTFKGCRTYPTTIDNFYLIDWRKWIINMNDNDNVFKNFKDMLDHDCTYTSIPSFYKHVISRPNPRAHQMFQSMDVPREDFPLLPYCSLAAVRSLPDNTYHYNTTTIKSVDPSKRFGLWVSNTVDSSLPQRQIDGKTYLWIGPGDFPLYMPIERGRNNQCKFYTYNLDTNLTNAFSGITIDDQMNIVEPVINDWSQAEIQWLVEHFFKVELRNGLSTQFNHPPTSVASWCIRFAGYVKGNNTISTLPYLPLGTTGSYRFSSERYTLVDASFRADPKSYSFQTKTAFILPMMSTKFSLFNRANAGLGKQSYLFTDKLRLYEGHVFNEKKWGDILEEFQAWDMMRVKNEVTNTTSVVDNGIFHADYFYYRQSIFDNSIYGLSTVSGSSHVTSMSEGIHPKRLNEMTFSYTGEINNSYVVWTGDERTSYVEYPSNVYKYLYRETDKGSNTALTAIDNIDNKPFVVNTWSGNNQFYAIIDAKGRIVKNKSTLYDIRMGKPEAFEPMTTAVRSTYYGTRTSSMGTALNNIKPVENNETMLLVANCFTCPFQGQNPDASKEDTGVPVNYISRNHVGYEEFERFVLTGNNQQREYRPSLYHNEVTPERFIVGNILDFNTCTTNIIEISGSNTKFLNAGGELYAISPIRDKTNEPVYCVPRMSLAGWTTPMYYSTKSWLGIPPDVFHDDINGIVTIGTWLYNPHLTAVDGYLAKFLSAIHGDYYERVKTNVQLVREDFDYRVETKLSQLEHPFDSDTFFRKVVALYRRIFAEGDYNKLERFALLYGKYALIKQVSQFVPT